MAKRLVWTDRAKAGIRAIDQQVACKDSKLSRDSSRAARAIPNSFGAVNRRYSVSALGTTASSFRDKGEYLEITRVLDRKEAYR